MSRPIDPIEVSDAPVTSATGSAAGSVSASAPGSTNPSADGGREPRSSAPVFGPVAGPASAPVPVAGSVPAPVPGSGSVLGSAVEPVSGSVLGPSAPGSTRDGAAPLRAATTSRARGRHTAGAGPDASRAPEIAHALPTRTRAGARRGPADPVKSLMHRHRALCQRAVDPLEIAAGLEAHGMTDRVAAHYRHRDVFSLAEELFARVPAVTEEPVTAHCAPERDNVTRAARSFPALVPGAARSLPALVPGAVCLATLGVLRATEGTLDGRARLAIAFAGTLLATLGLALALRGGPLRVAGGSTVAARAYACWLLGYVLYGEDLLHQVLSGGPEGPWTLTPAPLAGLALCVAPAAWCAHLFSVRAHRALVGSRTRKQFAAGVRPLLFGVVALHLCVLAVVLRLAYLGLGDGAFAGAAALGVLLLLARLLAVHGLPGPATAALAAACVVEALAPALVMAGRLPGLHVLARPVDVLVATAGTGAVPALACGVSALALLITAAVALPRASAHTADRPSGAAPAARAADRPDGAARTAARPGGAARLTA